MLKKLLGLSDDGVRELNKGICFPLNGGNNGSFG